MDSALVRRRSALPGLGLTLGFALTYLSLVVLIPLGALLVRAFGMPLADLVEVATSGRVARALLLSFGAAAGAAVINLIIGPVVAWVLVRYSFPGKRLLDAVVDLPFALPTAVAGIALASLFDRGGWFGRLLEPLGIQVAYTPAGIIVALVFIGLPFVVRTVQPVIEEVDRDVEEAAATLGAGRTQTIGRVILPTLVPAALTGFVLALARGIGEYGSVIFIAGNIPNRTEIAPLLIVIKLEEFDYPGAMAIAVIMLLISFALLLAVNLLQGWARRRLGET
jgi:sulfate transport system permease protein